MKRRSVPNLILWDFNGCLLDDCRHLYEHGVKEIFRRFGKEPPSFETFRREATSDFMSSFYWRHGIPREADAAVLDAIMRESYSHLAPPLFADAAVSLRSFHDWGVRQVLVTGCDQATCKSILARDGIARFFQEIHCEVREKAPVFLGALERAGAAPEEAVGATDSVYDAETLAGIGVKPYVCWRGFHAPEYIRQAQPRLPMMTVIPDLGALADLLAIDRAAVK
jgi:phosphoglycolate phosphatase-like HAD superfamily hydrolase